MKAGFVYIVANRKNGTIYIGVTSDLAKRAYEHREGIGRGLHEAVRVQAAGLVPSL